MCYPGCGMVQIKEPLLLIGNSSPCGGSGFSLSLSEWSFTICPTPYNRKQNVLSALLNKTFPSFLRQGAILSIEPKDNQQWMTLEEGHISRVIFCIELRRH